MELALAPAPLLLHDITKLIQHASTRSLLCAACGLLRELTDCPFGGDSEQVFCIVALALPSPIAFYDL